MARVVDGLGLSDRTLALIVTYPTFLIPFCTWLLMGYFRTIPKEIEECAMIDGCNRIQALLRIVLPMAVPGIICAVLFGFTLSWNEFPLLPGIHLHYGRQDNLRGCHLRTHSG